MTERSGIRPVWRRTARAVFAAAALAAACGAVPGRADEAAPEDEKYRKAFDSAVDRGLQYLARAQREDGSWPCNPASRTAVASLCIMACLARGHSPGLAPFGDSIDRGVDYVLSRQAPNGSLIDGGSMYCHNISALMLSEVSGMVDNARHERVSAGLAKALKVTLDAQRVRKNQASAGGWRYSPQSTDSDISHSGWALMALRSARNNGAAVPREAIDDAAKYILRCRTKDGGFAYQPGSASGIARAGVGLLCLELSGRHRDEVTLGAGKYISERFRGNLQGEVPFYCIYYAAQGMFQLGGEEWDRFAPRLYEMVLKYQAPDGSWREMPGKTSESAAGTCYRTSMAVLALSVTYRQLPIYQR